MARTLLYVVFLTFLACFVAESQQYYAILISGAGPQQGVLGKRDSELTEEDKDALSCWHGLFTMWKTLTAEQGYSTDHVYVLYRDGVKFLSDNNIYKGDIRIDGAANYANLQYFLTSTLKNQMTSNDVLFVFTGGHGDWTGTEGELDLWDTPVTASTFASWVDQIPCRKRIAFMAQCVSGDFAAHLVGNGSVPTIALSCCGTGIQYGARADDIPPFDGSDTMENERVGDPVKTYYHWEFDYHVTNAIRNRTFVHQGPLQGLDLSTNGGISLDEVFIWEQTRESASNSDPLFWDPRKLSSTTYVNIAKDLQYRQPAAPINVTVSGTVGQHPTISWSANTEPDLAGYKLYRMITPYEGGYNLIATLNNSTTSYVDNTTTRSGTNGPWAYYFVKAYDTSNRYSAGSDTTRICAWPPGFPKTSPDMPGQPTVHQLFDAYPIPFNPATTIRYALAEDAHVSVSVYNTLGQELAVLENGMQNAGYHETRFTAENLASGYRRVTKLLLTK